MRTGTCPSSPGSERRRLTILFADLVGSTMLSTQFDPEEMTAILRSYQVAVSAQITRFHGYVAKFMGDGVIAYFGWPSAHEDDAELAVRAGLGIVSATAALRAPSGERLAARVGIATGLVVVGELIGEGSAQERMVVGETPNVAARLQAEAAPGQVVIAEATRRLVSGSFDLATLEPRAIKGFAEKVPVHAVLAARETSDRFAARTAAAMHPLHGRDQELALLMEHWRLARSGKGQCVLLAGEAGIGKSRILRALLDALKDESHVRIQHQCSPYHADSAFWPVTQHLARAAGFAPDESNEQRLDRLETLLAVASRQGASDVPFIAALMGLDGTGRYGPLTLATAALRERTLQALVNQALQVASKCPLVLVFEDVHWIDPTTSELIERLIAAAAGAPMLIVVTSRPDNESPLATHQGVVRVMLERLGQDGVGAIVAELGGASLPERTVAEIVMRSDGIPLFVEELTKAVVESGDTSVPATLHDTLMARLDRLAELKEIVQIAACIGREFDFALLAAVAERPESQLANGLEHLARAELVFRRGLAAGTRYLFKHALVRDAAYESLLKSRRRAIHARLVAALEAESSATPPEILARHAELAGMVERAIAEFRRGAAAAAARPAFAEAIANYESALRLLATLEDGRVRDERMLETEIARAQTLAARSGYAAAETAAAFEHARMLAEKVGDARARFHIDWGQWVASYSQGDLPGALARGERALAGCEPDDPADVCTLARRMIGLPLVMMGRFEDSVRHLQESLAHFDPERHADHPERFGSDTRATSLIYIARAKWCLGAVDEALADIEASLTIARRIESGLARCQGLGFVGVLRCIIDPAGARDLVEELLTASTKAGVEFWQASAHGLRAGVRMARGDHLGALEDAAYCRDRLDRGGARGFQPIFLGFAAQAQIALGRFDDAASLLRDIDAMIAAGNRWTEADARRIEGELLLARGETAAAASCWHRAIAIARAQRAASWELRVATRLARLLIDQGMPEAGAALLAPAYAQITGGRNSPDLIAADSLLRGLGLARIARTVGVVASQPCRGGRAHDGAAMTGGEAGFPHS